MAFGAIIAWVVVFGTICALIGPRKGKTPAESFVFGAVFGIFAVVGMALMQDARPAAPDRGPDPVQPTRVRVYEPGREDWLRRDQADAAAHGWFPVARDFASDGSLRVTYEYRGPGGWTAPATSESSSLAPAALAVVGGAMLLFGVFLPWASIGIVSVAGLDADAEVAVASALLGGLTILAGARLAKEPEGWRALAALAVIAGVVAAAKVVQLRGREADIFGTAVQVQVGAGLWMMLAGAVLALLAALMVRQSGR